MTKLYGYARISTKEQNEDRQIIALTEYGVLLKNIFLDKQSGKDFERTNYKRMLKRLKKGNVLVIKSIDMLGRSYEDIIKQWQHITKNIGADIIILDMPLLNTTRDKDLIGTLISDIVLQILSYVSQNEREVIRQRQAEGIAAAKARGVKFGKPKQFDENKYIDIFTRYRKREITKNYAMERIKCSETSFYRMLGKLRKRKKVP